MSSSSSAIASGPRVLRGAGGDVASSTDLFRVDLAPAGLARLDPARVDEAVEEGRAAGFAAGLLEGRAVAEREQAQLTAEHRDRLARAVAAAEAALHDALDGLGAVAAEAAQRTAEAAFAVAEAVVGRELATATEPGRDAVARALALAPDGVDVTLRLNPDDLARLGAEPTPDRVVRVVADASLASGDCVARAGWTTIDARIGAALERVRSVLEGTA